MEAEDTAIVEEEVTATAEEVAVEAVVFVMVWEKSEKLPPFTPDVESSLSCEIIRENVYLVCL